MKISYSKVSLSLSANPISLIRGTFFAAAKVFTEFFYKISKLSPRLYRRHYTTLPLAERSEYHSWRGVQILSPRLRHQSFQVLYLESYSNEYLTQSINLPYYCISIGSHKILGINPRMTGVGNAY